MNTELSELEERIGYHFRDAELLRHAMTHSSYANEKRWGRIESNERLEFLGDAVLELVTSEFLFQRDDRLPEGRLTKLRASMVCEPTLALCARAFGMENYIFLGKGENHTGGRERDSIVSDALEALIGAIYLDGGYPSAQKFILSYVLNDLEHKQLFSDSKTALQELAQAQKGGNVSYRVVAENGPDHMKTFEVEAWIGDRAYGRGSGHSKKSAEQKAAYQAILRLGKTENRG